MKLYKAETAIAPPTAPSRARRRRPPHRRPSPRPPPPGSSSPAPRTQTAGDAQTATDHRDRPLRQHRHRLHRQPRTSPSRGANELDQPRHRADRHATRLAADQNFGSPHALTFTSGVRLRRLDEALQGRDREHRRHRRHHHAPPAPTASPSPSTPPPPRASSSPARPARPPAPRRR